MYNKTNGSLIRTLVGKQSKSYTSNNPKYFLAVLSDGSLVSVLGELTINIWNVTNGALIRKINDNAA